MLGIQTSNFAVTTCVFMELSLSTSFHVGWAGQRWWEPFGRERGDLTSESLDKSQNVNC